MDTVSYWIERLAEEHEARREAVTRLIDLGETALDPLHAALEAENPEVRARACFVLGKIRHARSLTALLARLEDPEPSVIHGAGAALARLGAPAVEPLIAVLRSAQGAALHAAIKALGLCRDSRALVPLTELLDGSDNSVIEAACRALGQLRDPQAAPALVGALVQPNGKLCRVAGAALEALLPDAALGALYARLHDPDPRLRAAVVRTLGLRREPDSAGVLIEALDDPAPEVRIQAADGLGRWWREAALLSGALVPRLKSEPAVEVRRAYVAELAGRNCPVPLPDLATCLEDPDPVIRQHAAEILGHLRSPVVIEALLPLLHAREETVRAAVALALARTGEARLLPQLLQVLPGLRTGISTLLGAFHQVRGNLAVPIANLALLDPHPLVRLAALNLFAGASPSEALPAFTIALHDPAVEIREGAVTALLHLGPDHVPALLARLHDPAPEVRKTIAQGLGERRVAAAVPQLLALAQDPEEKVRQAAVGALGRIGGPEARAGVLPFLRDPDSSVRQHAAHAVGTLWGAEAGPHLLPLLNDQWWTRQTAAYQLIQCPSTEVVNGLIAVLLQPEGRTSHQFVMAEVLGRIGDGRAVGPLVEALRIHADVRPYAAWALGELRDPATARPLTEELHRGNCNDEGFLVHMAAEALGKLADPCALPVLVEALDQTYSCAREAAAVALGKLRDPRAVDGLLAVLNDSSRDVVRAAAGALGRIGEARAAGPLAALLPHSDHLTRHALLRALQWTAGAAVVDPIAAQLTDDDAALRVLAANALGNTGSARAVPAVAAALHDPRGPVRRAAARALARLGAAALPALTAALSDSDFRIRRLAAASFRDPRQRTSVAALCAALSDPVPAVRTAAVHTLGSTGFANVAEAVKALLTALHDPVPAVRAGAAAGLGGCVEFAVEGALRQCLQDPEETVRRAAKSALRRLMRS